jgi:hypothetical protein
MPIATRQPQPMLTHPASGMNKSIPAADVPPRTPRTNPCLSLNHREAITEEICEAVKPGAMPRRIPCPSQSCHFVVVVTAR